MYESGYYPIGTQYAKDAPWNQKDNQEKEFGVTCSQSLSKTVSVKTDQYVVEYDGDGPYINTSETIWEEEYHDNDHYTPIQLIELFQKFLLDEVNGSNTVSRNPKYLNHIITECNNWTEDETEYVN